MKYEIKRATIKDLEVVRRLNEKLCIKEHKEFDSSIISNYSMTEKGKESFERCITADASITLIVEVDDRTVGYLTGGIQEAEDFRNIKYICELGSMWVDEEYRSEGIGKKLVGEFEKWCKKKDVSRLRVVVSAQNEQGIRFYKKEGFEDYDLVLEKNITI